MNLADILIVVVLVVSGVSAFVKGFFVEVFSLAGVFLGLFIAAANYGALTPWVLRFVKNLDVAHLVPPWRSTTVCEPVLVLGHQT